MTPSPRNPGLLRRLAAVVYDWLAVFSVLFVADALVVIPLQAGWGITGIGRHPLFQLFQLAVIVGFYGGFWTRGGQTLGLRTWGLRVVREDGGPLGWREALKRMGAALLSALPVGLGFLWAVIDPRGLMWHDRLSQTRIVFARDGTDAPGAGAESSGKGG